MRDMRLFIVIAVLFCAGIIGLAVFLTNTQSTQGPRLVPVHSSFTDRVENKGWTKGPVTAPVEMVEYADYQCPGCRAVASTISEVISSRPDTIRYVYRNFPLETIHNKSRLASRAAEAAGKQGKYWEMHEMLYARQLDWIELTSASFKSQLINSYAETLQLNKEQFQRDIEDSNIDDEINRDMEAGNAINLSSTPTIIINGQKLESIPTDKEAFLRIIDEAAKK